MAETLTNIFLADSFTYWVVAFLALLTVPMLRVFSSWAVTLFMLPGIWFGGLAGAYVFRDLVVLLGLAPDAQVVVGAGLGALCGLAVMLLVVRMIFAVAARTRPVELAGRTQVGRR